MVSILDAVTPQFSGKEQKRVITKNQFFYDMFHPTNLGIAEAKAQTQEMVSQHEVMQQAYAQANDTISKANKQAQEILDSAQEDANNIRLNAIAYTDDMLANLQTIMTNTLGDAGERYKAFMSSLQDAYEVVSQNRGELAPQVAQAPSETVEEESPAEYEDSEDDYDFEEE